MKKIRNLLTVMFALILSMTTFMAGIDGVVEEPVNSGQVSKTIKFELAKDYEGCSFTITTEKTGNFEVKMWSGTSEAYAGSIKDGNECVINIQDAKKGRWNITVTAILPEEPTVTPPLEF